MIASKQQVSAGEKKCIDYAISKGIKLSEKKSYIYFTGYTWKSQNSLLIKYFEKGYTPDIEFEIKGQKYWVEIKGMVWLGVLASRKVVFGWSKDIMYEERRPLIIDYCVKNNIIFKQFSSSSDVNKKFGLNDFKKWIDEVIGENND